MATPTLRNVLPVANGLGECILWDDRHGHVLWTDMPGKTLYFYDPANESIRTIDFDEDLCSFALLNNSDDLLCAFQSGFALLDRHRGECQWLHRIDNADLIRLNDGRVDRQGRFWCGSLIDSVGNTPQNGLSGELMRMNGDGALSKHLGGIGVSNSLCWSPDGSVMYFGDTSKKEIWAFDFERDAGRISNQRVFARTPDSGGPDGSCVDAEGFLWNAEWGAGRVVRYAPDGSVDNVLQLPTPHVTCLTFAGAELNDLYVTTASYGLSTEQANDDTQAGNVFVFETAYQGLPENRFMPDVTLQRRYQEAVE